QGEKPLRDILRFLWSGTFSPNEAVDRSPVSTAKVFKRFLCRWRFTLCLQHHAPVCCNERCRSDRCRTTRGVRSHVIWSGGHSLITVKRGTESKPACSGTDGGFCLGANLLQ